MREADAETSTTALQDFVELLSQPESLGASIACGREEHRALLAQVCQLLFQQIERLGSEYARLTERPSPLSGLEELFTGDSLNAETLWGQIDLQNEPLLTLLRKSVKQLGKTAETRPDDIRLLDEVDSDEEDNEIGQESESEEEASEADENDEDEETQRMRSRMERAMDDMDESENEEDNAGSSGDDESAEDPTQSSKANEEDALVDPAAEELNDGFFDINEMEAFADEEEEYLPDEAFGQEKPEEPTDKRSFHQRQRDGDVGEDSDDDNDDSDDEEDDNDLLFRKQSTIRRKRYREDDEIDALYSLYDKPKNDDDDDEDDVTHLTAADIFGRPNKKYYDKYKSRPKQDANQKGDDDSWDEYDFEQSERQQRGWADGVDDEDADADNAVVGDSASDGEPDESVPMKGETSKSTGKGQPKRLLDQTEQLEKEMLAEKPWQMKGETSSGARPVNSLLDSTPDFEVATKMAPIITVQQTQSLEETIKQRILNEDWDDVVPRELPDVGWNMKRGELPEVSQEKSKLGLGELYEREYLKKAVGYDVDAAEKETEEEKAKNEMRSLFANLCSKLDALSNYHFAPRPVADEAEVKVLTKPAIAMEEVLPLHVSDSRAAAPEEIYGTKRGREGVLRADSELEQQERKRLRSSKKAARRKARKAKLADEKLISRLQPGLGLNNPYENRKMREELSMARAEGKITTGQADTNDYGASTTFFKRMQQEAEQSIRGEKEQPEKKKERKSVVSSALKL